MPHCRPPIRSGSRDGIACRLSSRLVVYSQPAVAPSCDGLRATLPGRASAGSRRAIRACHAPSHTCRAARRHFNAGVPRRGAARRRRGGGQPAPSRAKRTPAQLPRPRRPAIVKHAHATRGSDPGRCDTPAACRPSPSTRRAATRTQPRVIGYPRPSARMAFPSGVASRAAEARRNVGPPQGIEKATTHQAGQTRRRPACHETSGARQRASQVGSVRQPRCGRRRRRDRRCPPARAGPPASVGQRGAPGGQRTGGAPPGPRRNTRPTTTPGARVGPGTPVVAAREVLLDQRVEDDVHVPAPHLLDEELRLAGLAPVPVRRAPPSTSSRARPPSAAARWSG